MGILLFLLSIELAVEAWLLMMVALKFLLRIVRPKITPHLNCYVNKSPKLDIKLKCDESRTSFFIVN